MAQAGYCSECKANVWLTTDGICPAGHGADCISNVYEADTPAPPPSPEAAARLASAGSASPPAIPTPREGDAKKPLYRRIFRESAPCPHCGVKVREHSDSEHFLCPHCAQPGPFATPKQVARWNAKQTARSSYEQALALIAGGQAVGMGVEQLAEIARTAKYLPEQITSMNAATVTQLALRLVVNDLLTVDEDRQLNEAAALLGVSVEQACSSQPGLQNRLVVGLANVRRLAILSGRAP
jgi:hypothetical protein